jgi:hypothetical protein
MVVTGLMTGWAGRALGDSYHGTGENQSSTPSGGQFASQPSFILRREPDHRIGLTATAGDVMLTKAVSPDGASEARLEYGGDAVTILSSKSTIVASRGRQSVTVNVHGGHERQMRRLRALFLGSEAIRGIRTLATVLDESDSDAPEKMAVRLTGVLIAQLDGDEGAVRRLSRSLVARYQIARRSRRGMTDDWDTYRLGVLKAGDDLEQSLEPFGFTNPMRQVSSFVWVRIVEGLWVEYVGSSVVRLH